MREHLATCAAAALLLTACTGQDSTVPRAAPATTAVASSEAGPAPASTPPAAPRSAPASTPWPVAEPSPPEPEPQPEDREPEAPFVADRSRDTATHDGGRLSVVDLRAGRHEGYDRVVLELAGDGRPGWFAQYREVPRHQGRGNRADVRGQTVLEVSVTGVRYPNERGTEQYEGPQVLRPRGTRVVTEVLRGSIYEGHQQLFIGIGAREQPFRVFRLPDPPRVVVDVQHPR